MKRTFFFVLLRKLSVYIKERKVSLHLGALSRQANGSKVAIPELAQFLYPAMKFNLILVFVAVFIVLVSAATTADEIDTAEKFVKNSGHGGHGGHGGYGGHRGHRGHRGRRGRRGHRGHRANRRYKK